MILAAHTSDGLTHRNFQHGVGSAQAADGVAIIWTRLTLSAEQLKSPEKPVRVQWELALDPDFTDRVKWGSVTIDSVKDVVATADVTGLISGTKYYYRFHALWQTSPFGRIQAMPGHSSSGLHLRHRVRHTLGRVRQAVEAR